MTPDTFMDTFMLARNSLEKQDTQFREAFPTEKRVAIAFRIIHQKCCMKKGLRPTTLLKKRFWHWCFPLNFAEFLRRPFLQNTCGRLLLCFMVLSTTRDSYRNISKTFTTGKSTVVSIIVYWNILSNFREPQVEQPKQLLHLKKPLTVKFVRLLM